MRAWGGKVTVCRCNGECSLVWFKAGCNSPGPLPGSFFGRQLPIYLLIISNQDSICTTEACCCRRRFLFRGDDMHPSVSLGQTGTVHGSTCTGSSPPPPAAHIFVVLFQHTSRFVDSAWIRPKASTECSPGVQRLLRERPRPCYLATSSKNPTTGRWDRGDDLVGSDRRRTHPDASR